MRITYIITRSDSIGGAHIHLLDLALALLQRGHDVHVVVGGKGHFCERLREFRIAYTTANYLVRELSPHRDLMAVGELYRILRTLKPDLVANHSSKAGWLGRCVARLMGIPVLFTAHGWAFTDGVDGRAAKLYRLAERCVGRLADRIITVSDYDRELAIRNRIAPRERIVRIHNGIPDVAPNLRADPQKDPPRLVMVARFDEPKDHLTLFEALRGLLTYEWTLDLLGDGPLRDEIERKAYVLGLRERVRFLGHRTDIPPHLATAQIFVLTSKWEGLPLSILEAMRAGLPVIASDVGGVKESVRDGQTGFLVPRLDVDTLRRRLEELIKRPELRVAMGQQGRRLYDREFRFERMLEETLRVYTEVLAERGLAHRVGGASLPPDPDRDRDG